MKDLAKITRLNANKISNPVRQKGFVQNWKLLAVAVVVGSAIGYGAANLSGSDSATGGVDSSVSAEKKPLYWVAPMDPTFKSDKPGKSPMGMDLVPVYEESGNAGIKVNDTEAHNLALKTAKVSRGSFSGQIRTVGYVGFDEDEVVHMHTRVQGWIEKLQVKAVGDEVKKGDLLFELYSPELVNAEKEFLTALRSGQQSLIRAASDRLIYLGLTKSQVAELKRTKVAKDRLEVRAPISGVLGAIKVGEGAFVGPAKEIMSISNLEKIWINADVFQRDAGLVKVGQTADITIEGFAGRSWQGRVDYIYPVLNPRSRTLRVRFVVDNQDRDLKPNMFANIEVAGESATDRIQVPRAALIRGPINRVVVKTDDQHYQVKVVKPGRESSEFVEVLAGLNGDETVVVSSQFLIDSESNLDEALKRFEEQQTGQMSDDMNGDMSGMDHSNMNHSNMDHSKMNHDQMKAEQPMKCGAGMDMSKMKKSDMKMNSEDRKEKKDGSSEMKCGGSMDMSGQKMAETSHADHQMTADKGKNPFSESSEKISAKNSAKSDMKCGAGMDMSGQKTKEEKIDTKDKTGGEQ